MFHYIKKKVYILDTWKRTLGRRTKWIGHILRRNCLIDDAIVGQMTEVKEGRSTQFLDDMRNRRRYWELKEEAKDRERGKRQLIMEYKEGIKVIFLKSMGLLINSIL